MWSVGCRGDVAHASSWEKAAGASGTTGTHACGHASSWTQEEHWADQSSEWIPRLNCCFAALVCCRQQIAHRVATNLESMEKPWNLKVVRGRSRKIAKSQENSALSATVSSAIDTRWTLMETLKRLKMSQVDCQIWKSQRIWCGLKVATLWLGSQVFERELHRL